MPWMRWRIVKPSVYETVKKEDDSATGLKYVTGVLFIDLWNVHYQAFTGVEVNGKLTKIWIN
jgi:hypothetical protein